MKISNAVYLVTELAKAVQEILDGKRRPPYVAGVFTAEERLLEITSELNAWRNTITRFQANGIATHSSEMNCPEGIKDPESYNKGVGDTMLALIKVIEEHHTSEVTESKES